MGKSRTNGSYARRKGIERHRRRHRAWRRAATAETRERYNEMMRKQGHPGWS